MCTVPVPPVMLSQTVQQVKEQQTGRPPHLGNAEDGKQELHELMTKKLT